MTWLNRGFVRAISMLLMLALVILTTPMAQAKPITADRVHTRIVKAGLGNWVGVELQNGTAFAGRLVSIDDQSFGLQLHNDPQITPVLYSDVVDLRAGISRKGFWTLTIVGFGGVAAAAAVGFYEVHKHDQPPTLPSQPTQPVFPY
jgi:hypothetical protein